MQMAFIILKIIFELAKSSRAARLTLIVFQRSTGSRIRSQMSLVWVAVIFQRTAVLVCLVPILAALVLTRCLELARRIAGNGPLARL